jgi:hypothetical protein
MVYRPRFRTGYSSRYEALDSSRYARAERVTAYSKAPIQYTVRTPPAKLVKFRATFFVKPLAIGFLF